MIKSYKKELQLILAISLFKLIILVLLPLTGDEAYFIKWGTNPSLGYYDHPPMVGWIIYLMNFISTSHIFFRLFSVLTTFVTAFVIYKIAILYKVEQSKAFYTSLVFLASPVDVLLVLMTNDITLLFFSSLGTLFLLYSLDKKEWFVYSALSGIFLGLAFLSKYFSTILMLSLLIFSIYMYRKKALKNVMVAAFIISIFIIQNLYFNYNSCWNNILFNFFTRTDTSSYNINTVFGYMAIILYILTPWGLYFLLKSKFTKSSLLILLISILGVAFSIFFIVSLKNKIGLHWLLLFIPYMFLLFTYLDSEKLKKLFKYNALFTFTHIGIVIILLLLPISLAKEHKKYSDLVMYMKPKALCKEIEKIQDSKIFVPSYSSASLLSYHCKKDVITLFSNSKYGRFDDKLFDVRTLSNRDITLFNKKPIEESLLKSVCSSFKLDSFKVDGATFYTAKCVDFNYDSYKKIYIDYQNKKFYNIPSWLPTAECYFKERYYK